MNYAYKSGYINLLYPVGRELRQKLNELQFCGKSWESKKSFEQTSDLIYVNISLKLYKKNHATRGANLDSLYSWRDLLVQHGITTVFVKIIIYIIILQRWLLDSIRLRFNEWTK